ncbi:MAG: hypothetical protein J7K20_01625 [Thermodesulfobacterium sp.]|nr:hypothetical protein [Thermodesulfobacterium sp.]
MKKYFHKAEFPEHSEPPDWWWFGKNGFGKLMWSIFGNSDDPEPIDKFYPSDWSQTKKRLHWYFVRNPLHNFDFYVIGFRDHDRVIYGKEPTKVFIDEGWNYYVSRILPYRWLWVLFVSYQKRIGDRVFQFYIGWRHGASFGFKLRYHKEKERRQ